MDAITARERQAKNMPFLAPCVPGGMAVVSAAGKERVFRLGPDDYEGWGIFLPVGQGTAEWMEAASLPLVMEYLHPLPGMRLRLVRSIRRKTWLATPACTQDYRQRGESKPMIVHLVEEGEPSLPVFARDAGGVWWFEMRDRRNRSSSSLSYQNPMRLPSAEDALPVSEAPENWFTVCALSNPGTQGNSSPLSFDPPVCSIGLPLSDRERDYDLTLLPRRNRRR